MPNPCPPHLIPLAERLADAAGAAIRPWFRRHGEVLDKEDHTPVTLADRAAEQAIRDILAAERPTDGIIGEEFGTSNDDAEYVWVIDPIDGTKQFITGRPLFGTLIGLMRHGRFIMGIIDQPIINDRWIGAQGRLTIHNGKPVETRACPSLAKATLTATTPDMFRGPQHAAFVTMSEACKLTVYGSDCYAYGLLASGFFDLVMEARLKIYDYAALVPIIEGAGGIITDWQGRPLDSTSGDCVLAAGDAVCHAAALAILQGI